MSGIFYNVEPKIINTELACILGLNEAIVLQQLHYWIEKNKATATNFRDGHYWTYGTLQGYRDRDFRFWSLNTVKRVFTRLHELGFLIKGNYNKKKMDNTCWYAIDYAALDEWIGRNKAGSGKPPLQRRNETGKPKMGQSESPEWANAQAQNGLAEEPKMGLSVSPKWATPQTQNRTAGEPKVGPAIQEIKKEITYQRLENKTHTQKTAPPIAAANRTPLPSATAPAGARERKNNAVPYKDFPKNPAFDGEVLDPADLLFGKFWEMYPRKESMSQAWKAWKQLNPDQALFDLIANALEYRSQTKEWLSEGGRYVPHPAKWLNERRWEDRQSPQKLSQAAQFQARFGGMTIDGKPLDPIQRKQMEHIQKRMREQANGGTSV